MRRARWGLLLALTMGAPSCGRTLPPRGQIILYVDTDAVVQRKGSADPLALASQVDRVRFDLMDGAASVTNGVRVFEIYDDDMREQKVSFGVVPDPGTTPSVRVRLYRSDRATADAPSAGVVIDQIVSLPTVPDEGIVEVSTFLSAERFGVQDAVPAVLGRPGPSAVSTWRSGRRVGCAAPPNEDEACVPGSAFFFGDPQPSAGARSSSDVVRGASSCGSRRSTSTRHEVTVGELRAKSERLDVDEAHRARRQGRRSTDTDDELLHVDDHAGLVPRMNLPVNCVPVGRPRRTYCQSDGQRAADGSAVRARRERSRRRARVSLGATTTSDCARAPCGEEAAMGIYIAGSRACRVGRARVYPTGPALGRLFHP